MTGPVAEALSVGISLALLLVFYVLWRDFWIDEVRNEIFELRDNMFVYAFENDLIEHPAYRLSRELMNSVLRYSHEISGARFLMLAIASVFVRPPVPQRFLEWKEAVEHLPSAERVKFVEFHSELNLIIGRQVFRTSILLRLAAYLVGIILWLAQGSSDGRRKLAERMPLDLLEKDAMVAACP